MPTQKVIEYSGKIMSALDGADEEIATTALLIARNLIGHKFRSADSSLNSLSLEESHPLQPRSP